MKPPVRTKPASAATDPIATDSPFTIRIGSAHREKLQRMVAYCLMNGLDGNSGVILRTLLDHAPEKSAELLGQIKSQMAKEKDVAREKRRQP